MITSIESYYVHSSEIFHTFHRMFYNMPHITCHMPYIIFPRNVWRHSPEYLATFLGMFEDIPRNVWRTSECLRTFPGMFEGIPLNVWPHSSECLRTFPRIQHSPYSSRSPHSVPRSCIPGFIHSPNKQILMHFDTDSLLIISYVRIIFQSKKRYQQQSIDQKMTCKYFSKRERRKLTFRVLFQRVTVYYIICNCVNIYISQSIVNYKFFNRFKSAGLPYITYIVIH